VRVGGLLLALVVFAGCRRDDEMAASMQPQGSASTGAAALPGVAAPVQVAVVVTPFDVKEPTALPSPSPAEGCSLDKVGLDSAAETTEVSREGDVRLVGWAADTNAKTIPPLVVIQLTGNKKYYAPAVHATPRPDVAQAYGAPNLVGAGWDVLGNFSKVDPGLYEVRILEVSPAGDALVCDPKKKLTVK
jgi:hypothetical protein